MDGEFKDEQLAKLRQNDSSIEDIGFYIKLSNMTERVKAFRNYFCNKDTFYERQYKMRKILRKMRQLENAEARNIAAWQPIVMTKNINPGVRREAREHVSDR